LRGRHYLDAIQAIAPGNVPGVDFHLHTTWTDGENSAVEMHNQAIARGLSSILFSEHARKSSGDWFPEFAREVRSLPRSACTALVGVETKVESFAGSLDCTPNILAQADVVMASVHRFPGEQGVVRGFGDVKPEEAVDLEFRLAMAVLENPDVDILGHPFGMCYRRYHVRPPDEKMRALIARAASTGVAFEVNAHYHPHPWQLIEWCLEAGARLSLGSNAHRTADIGRIVSVLEGKEKPWCPSGF
jgi:putative hydrolase